MRSPSAWLLVLVVLLAAGNLGSTLSRSGIPAELTGYVERVEVRREKHAGLDDAHLVTIGERELHLDAEVAALLHEGDEVGKAAWSTDLVIQGHKHRVGLSKDFIRMALAMPLLVILAGGLLWRRRQRAEGPR